MMDAPAADAPSHVPVMLNEVMTLLQPGPGEVVVDATVGAAGHAAAILGSIGAGGMLIGLDRDPMMAEAAAQRLKNAPNVRVLCRNYSEIDLVLKELGHDRADGVLLDLGFASPQVDLAERGFSYRADGPLDMRMTPDEGPTAADWINRAPEKEIADVLYAYGDERFSRRIARAIARARERAFIGTTGELAEIIRRAVPRGPRRLHPARRSFQAIRVHVNREMEHLDALLAKLPSVLCAGGRAVAISYHSHEDRRVKNAFGEGAREGLYERLTRRPLRPSAAEVEANPRSRSAKLRAVRRLPEGGGA